jgi:hypothetical protein
VQAWTDGKKKEMVFGSGLVPVCGLMGRRRRGSPSSSSPRYERKGTSEREKKRVLDRRIERKNVTSNIYEQNKFDGVDICSSRY